MTSDKAFDSKAEDGEANDKKTLGRSLVSQLVAALSPVNHRWLHQGCTGKDLCVSRDEDGEVYDAADSTAADASDAEDG